MSGRFLAADFKGLVTAPGLLARDQASLTQANNVVIAAPGVLEKRPGLQRLAAVSGGPIYRLYSPPPESLSGDKLYMHIGDSSAASGIRYGDGTAATVALTTVDATTVPHVGLDKRSQWASTRGAEWVAGCSYGVRRIEADKTKAIRYAGVARGLTLNVANTTLTGATGFLPTAQSVSYRVTWHRVHGGITVGGAPTGRFTIRNATGGNRDVSCRIPLPREYGTAATALDTSYFWRLWRTRTSIGGLETSDEFYLVAEAYLTAANIAAGYVTQADATTDTALVTLGAPLLHTNSNSIPPGEENVQQGSVNEDAPPPNAVLVASWGNCVWYGDVTSQHILEITLLTNLASTNTITIDGIVFDARAAPGALPQFQLGATIEATCQSLVNAINDTASAHTVAAYYVSTGHALPGRIRIESRRYAEFTAQSATAVCWPSIATARASTQEVAPYRVYFSKPGRPDNVAPINFLDLPSQCTIYALVPFRSAMFVFTDAGIYRVSGAFPYFQVAPFDLGYNIVGRDSTAVCDDMVYAWCWEGILELDDSGARVISTPIEPTVAVIAAGASRTKLRQGCFTLAYRSRHAILFFYPDEDFDAATYMGAWKWLRFDTRSRAWTTGDYGAKTSLKSCGTVRYSDDRLVVASWNSTAADAYMFAEAAGTADADFSDTTNAGARVAITSTVTGQYLVLEPERHQHWQDAVVHWHNPETNANLDTPSAATLTFASEVSSGAVVAAPSGPLTRVLVPMAARRCNRLRVSLSHAVAGEYMGINGLALRFAGSAIGRRG